jgi:hypothetical protein
MPKQIVNKKDSAVLIKNQGDSKMSTLNENKNIKKTQTNESPAKKRNSFKGEDKDSDKNEDRIQPFDLIKTKSKKNLAITTEDSWKCEYCGFLNKSHEIKCGGKIYY